MLFATFRLSHRSHHVANFSGRETGVPQCLFCPTCWPTIKHVRSMSSGLFLSMDYSPYVIPKSERRVAMRSFPAPKAFLDGLGRSLRPEIIQILVRIRRSKFTTAGFGVFLAPSSILLEGNDFVQLLMRTSKRISHP